MKSNSEISKRYAKALIELCGDSKSLEKVEKDILNLNNLMNSNDEIKEILKSQIISRDNLAKIMEDVLKTLNSKPLTIKFVGTIALNGRLQNIQNIVCLYTKVNILLILSISMHMYQGCLESFGTSVVIS